MEQNSKYVRMARGLFCNYNNSSCSLLLTDSKSTKSRAVPGVVAVVAREYLIGSFANHRR